MFYHDVLFPRFIHLHESKHKCTAHLYRTKKNHFEALSVHSLVERVIFPSTTNTILTMPTDDDEDLVALVVFLPPTKATSVNNNSSISA